MKHLVKYEVEINNKHQFIKENYIKNVSDDSFFHSDIGMLGIFNDNEIEHLYYGGDVEYKYNEGMSTVYSIIDDEIEEYTYKQEYINYQYHGNENYDSEAYD